MVRTAIAIALAFAAASCTTYQDDLARGQKAFEQHDYDRSLAIFRELEPDTSRLTVDERARYAYLRGMTDYRIGYRADARHWLSVAKSIVTNVPGAMPGDWVKRTDDALAELNEEVYATGIASLSNTETATPRQDDFEVDAGGGASHADASSSATIETTSSSDDAGAASAPSADAATSR